jgi:LDH2 family malate/lactate/ureidoglycolate dehydrogenase
MGNTMAHRALFPTISMPGGGRVAGHKDYGFALAAALIGGLAQGGDPAPSIGETEWDKPPINGVTIIVIDPAAIGERLM